MRRHRIVAGRWAIFLFEGEIGDYHAVRYTSAMKRTEADYRALLVSGRMRMIQVPEGIDLSFYKDKDHIVGMGTEDLPEVPKIGTYVRICDEPSRLICVSRKEKPFAYRNENRNTPFHVPKDGIFVLGSGRAHIIEKCAVFNLLPEVDIDISLREVSAPVAIIALNDNLTIVPRTIVHGITAYVTKETKKGCFIKNET